MNIYMVNQGELQQINKLIFSSGDSYVVDDDTTIWVWHGKGASTDERASAAVHARKISQDRGDRTKVIVVDEGCTVADKQRFKQFCGEHGGYVVVDKDLAESFLTQVDKPSRPPVLFKVSSEEFGGDINAMEAIQVSCKKEELDPDNVMVLWVHDESKTYIWIGKDANVKERHVARRVAMSIEKEFPGKQTEIFMDQGKEPAEFWAVFEQQPAAGKKQGAAARQYPAAQPAKKKKGFFSFFKKKQR